MNEDQKRAYELVLFHLRDYDQYHHRKEQMAYAVSVLYLAGGASLLASDFWIRYAPWQFALFGVLFVITALAAIAFVRWQFQRRL